MTMDPGAPSAAVVQITLGQVYSEVTGMRSDLRDLTTTMKTAVGQLGDHETRLRTVEHDYVTQAELEKVTARLATVERRVWMAVGGFGAISIGLGALPYLKH